MRWFRTRQMNRAIANVFVSVCDQHTITADHPDTVITMDRSNECDESQRHLVHLNRKRKNNTGAIRIRSMTHEWTSDHLIVGRYHTPSRPSFSKESNSVTKSEHICLNTRREVTHNVVERPPYLLACS